MAKGVEQRVGALPIGVEVIDAAPIDTDCEPVQLLRGDFVTVCLFETAFEVDLFIRMELPGESTARKTVLRLTAAEPEGLRKADAA